MVLEIRVHGVSNTPPQSTLQEWQPEPPAWDAAPPPDPRLVDGDLATSGFYRRPGYEPSDDLVVEAYSWGQLTQGSRLGRRDLQRAAWALLLPFALANVAVWAVPGRNGRRHPLGTFAARVLGLSLTVTFALGFAGVAMSEVAWQCGGQGPGCAHSVPYTGFLRDGFFATGLRPVAVAMLVPVLALGVLYAIARRSFAYEAQVPHVDTGSAGANEFRDRHFWSGATQVRALAQVHLSAAVLTVGLLAAVGAARLSRHHRTVFAVEAVVLGVLAVAVVLLLLHPSVRTRSPGSGPAAKLPLVLALLSWLGWATVATTMLLAPPVTVTGDAPQWPGFSGAVSVLFGVQVAAVIVLAGAATNWWSRGAVAVPLVAAAALMITHAVHRSHHLGRGGALALALAALAVVLLLASPARREYRALDPPAAGLVEGPYDGLAWRGKAAALFAGAGLMLAVIYMAAALTAVANYLNGPHAVTSSTAVVHVPTALLWAGLGLIAAVTALAVVMAWAWSRYRLDQRSEAQQVDDDQLPGYERARAAAVARARALHRFDGWRAVHVLGVLAGIGLFVCIGGAALTALGLDPSGATGTTGHPNSVLTRLTNIGGSVSAFVVVLIGLVLMNIYRSDGPIRHVFGVVWDLATFWPRAAHPFAPPCYAERAVPQLVTKIVREPAVIMACHSQGTLIGMATLFQLGDARHVRFLTYGTQLNRLYGRIFPLFCGRLERDALADHVGQPASPPERPQDWRWVSLWRPTDFIGWSVGSRVHDVEVPDPIALTGPPGQVSLPVMHRHSDYPLSREYVEWRDRLRQSFNA